MGKDGMGITLVNLDNQKFEVGLGASSILLSCVYGTRIPIENIVKIEVDMIYIEESDWESLYIMTRRGAVIQKVVLSSDGFNIAAIYSPVIYKLIQEEKLQMFRSEMMRLQSKISDWTQFAQILEFAGTTELCIKTDVELIGLKGMMRKLPQIKRLTLEGDLNWNKMREIMKNIDKKMLHSVLRGPAKNERVDNNKGLSTLCDEVCISELKLSFKGHCERICASKGYLSIGEIYLHSGQDVLRLYIMVSHCQSRTFIKTLYLINLKSDGWALLPLLLRTLDSVDWVEITASSTPHWTMDTVTLLVDKIKG